jgi:exonuclease SbcC
VEERAAAEGERQALEARAQIMEARRTELERARRAETVLPAARRLQDAQDRTRDLREEERRLADQAEHQAQALAAAETALGIAEGQEIRREELRRSIARLKELEPKLAALEEARKEVRASALERGRLEDEVSEHRRQAERTNQELSKAQVLLQELRTEASQADGREHLLYLVKKQRGQRDELERFWTQAKDAKESLDDAEGALWAAKDERAASLSALQQILTRRQEAQAAALARSLEPGAPCPVCGSTEHPLPARSAADLPDEEAIQTAQDRFDLAETALARAQENVNQRHLAYENLRARTDTLLDALGDLAQQPAEVFATQEAERRADLERSRLAATRLPSAELDGQAAEAAKAAADHTLDDGLLRLDEVRTRETEAKAKVRFLEESLLSELRAPGALSTRREQAERELAASEEELREARSSRDSAQSAAQGSKAKLEAHRERMHDGLAEISACEVELDQAIASARFRDHSDFELAKRTAEEQSGMAQELEGYDAALQSAEDRLRRAKEQAREITAPDLSALRAAVDEAQERIATAGQELGQAESELENLQRVRQALEDKDREIAALDRRYRVLGKLSRAAKGEDGARISFERYVQGAILDEVLISASARLRKMSKHRYALRRALGSGDLRKAGGLDLEVTDSHTGRARAVSTLSGGEGFLASLALALGLSDVVQRNAGGIRLDTVFIDEGFGSLDQESLDLALRTLEELKQGGRLVGLISHLEEVKARIPARLEVIPGPGGSTALFRVGV